MASATTSSYSLQHHDASPWIDVGNVSRCYNGASQQLAFSSSCRHSGGNAGQWLPLVVHAVKAATAQGGSSCVTVSAAPLSSSVTLLPAEGVKPGVSILSIVKLPELSCSFPSVVHPQYEQLKPHCDKWIECVAELSSPSASCFLQQCLLPRLVCRFIPRASSSRQRLLQAIKLIAWLMVVDDDDDPELLGSDYATTCYCVERIMAILTEPADAFQDRRLWNFDLLDCRLSKRCSRRLAALADLWLEICPQMSPLLRSRFTSSMADYLEGIKMQAWLRTEARVPIRMDSYMKIRRQASFSIPAFIMAEYASGIELDQAILEHAKVVELRNKAVDYITLCKDIFSCYKQMSLGGNCFNLPSILQYNACAIYWANIGANNSTRARTQFQRALDHVAQLARDLDASCTVLAASLKNEYSKRSSADPLKAHRMHAYVDVIALGMSGALAWFYETPRYAQPYTSYQL